MVPPALRIGVDLGGTKIELAVLGADDRILLRRRVPTPPRDYEATIAAVVALVESAEAELGARGSIGLGHPGSISPTSGLIRNANSTALNGRPLDRDLREALAARGAIHRVSSRRNFRRGQGGKTPLWWAHCKFWRHSPRRKGQARWREGLHHGLLGRDLRMANDANCFALSEASDGAAAGSRCVFGVILGTGVGGGLVIDGRLLEGANAIAGEWGHSPLPRMTDGERPGPRCYCGRRGCIETFLSGQGLVEDYHWTEQATEPLTARDIVEAAALGDAPCRRVVERYAERLARSLAVVINLVDPDAIVLGGGLSNCAALYELVPGLWGREVFSDHVRTRLLPPKFGDSSGVRGAARLWPVRPEPPY